MTFNNIGRERRADELINEAALAPRTERGRRERAVARES
jgi:hypothetical protein